jgi:hypothetical protein
VFLRAETSSSRASMSLLPAGCRCTSRTRTTLSVLLDFPFVPCAFLPASSPPHPNPVWSRLPEATTYLTSLELTLKHTSRSERFKNWSSRGFTSKLPTQAGLPSLTFHLFFPGPLLSLSLSYLDRITFGFKGLNFQSPPSRYLVFVLRNSDPSPTMVSATTFFFAALAAVVSAAPTCKDATPTLPQVGGGEPVTIPGPRCSANRP